MTLAWNVDANYKNYFPDFNTVFNYQGEFITKSPISKLFKVNIAGVNYYVKLYFGAGKALRRYVGRSRIKAEWENLALFESLGIKVPCVVASGEERCLGRFVRGLIVTKELEGALDLEDFAKQNLHLIRNYHFNRKLIQQLASYTSKLHHIGFIHNDLKWRNILIQNKVHPEIYFIDCPVGRKRYGWLRKRGILKDLACLDKKAKYIVNKTTRLKFYMTYYDIQKLTKGHKNQIRKILRFFQGRE